MKETHQITTLVQLDNENGQDFGKRISRILNKARQEFKNVKQRDPIFFTTASNGRQTANIHLVIYDEE